MKTIVALIDFSDVTFKVLKQVHALAKGFGSHVVLLHVAPKNPVVVDVGLISPTVLQEPTPEQEHAEEAKLRELQESLAKFGVTSTVRQIHAAGVEQLLAEAGNHHPDLIVVGSHRHGSLFELLHSTITAQVVRKAPCPVVVVPSN
ncbi:MAG TPA: universal stress protein [Prosthecobacter sp.]|nr:universal stress protein [Prosthecobacter sp.]